MFSWRAEQVDQLGFRDSPGEVKTLIVAPSKARQHVKLIGALRAFGDDIEIERPAERQDRVDDGLLSHVFTKVTHE